jgi:hypothetical protein
MSPSSSRGGRNGHAHLVSCFGSVTRRCDNLKPPGIRYGAQLFIYYLLSFSGGTGVSACLPACLSHQERSFLSAGQTGQRTLLARLASGSLRQLREAPAACFRRVRCPNASGSGSRRAARIWRGYATASALGTPYPGSMVFPEGAWSAEAYIFSTFCLPLRILRWLVSRSGHTHVIQQAPGPGWERTGWESPPCSLSPANRR